MMKKSQDVDILMLLRNVDQIFKNLTNENESKMKEISYWKLLIRTLIVANVNKFQPL